MEATAAELLNKLIAGNKSFTLHIDLDHLDLQYRMNSTTGNTWQLIYQRQLVELMLNSIGYSMGSYDERSRSYNLKKLPDE